MFVTQPYRVAKRAWGKVLREFGGVQIIRVHGYDVLKSCRLGLSRTQLAYVRNLSAIHSIK